MIVRNPKNRFISQFNFCKSYFNMKMNINQYIEFFHSLNNNINNNKKFQICNDNLKYLSNKNLNEKNNLIISEHSLEQFLYLKILKINKEDIKIVLRTENLTNDISLFLKKEFNIDFKEDIRENITKNKVLKKIDNKLIEHLIVDDLEYYNYFINKFYNN